MGGTKPILRSLVLPQKHNAPGPQPKALPSVGKGKVVAQPKPLLRPLILPQTYLPLPLRSPSPGPPSPRLPISPCPPYSPNAPARPPTPLKKSSAGHPHASGGVVPISRNFVLCLILLLSISFILALSCSFIGFDINPDGFTGLLNDVAQNTPGIVLLGENVDVDVDEPSVGIRWSILGCGSGFVLNGSAGAHGSDLCGLPSMPLQIFADGSTEAVASYDPSLLPFNQLNLSRRYIQNLVQFDTDHVLDVHNAPVYPFDTYFLTTTLHIINPTTQTTLPIARIATIAEVSAFSIKGTDIETFSLATSSSGSQNESKADSSAGVDFDAEASTETNVSPTVAPQTFPTRDLDLLIFRPPSARAYALLIWATGWLLAEGTVGQVFIVSRASAAGGAKPVIKHLVCAFAILVAMPQMRDSMPDGPDLDGVLIDCIGFFPQMIITTLSTIGLFIIAMAREFSNEQEETSATSSAEADARDCKRKGFSGPG